MRTIMPFDSKLIIVIIYCICCPTLSDSGQFTNCQKHLEIKKNHKTIRKKSDRENNPERNKEKKEKGGFNQACQKPE